MPKSRWKRGLLTASRAFYRHLFDVVVPKLPPHAFEFLAYFENAGLSSGLPLSSRLARAHMSIEH